MRLDETGGTPPTFLLRFHGVRGSFPVPREDSVHFGGNTSCIEVEAGPFRVVFDCGTGVVPLGQRLQAEALAAARPVRLLMLISHVHHDHTMGFPFFKPVYDPATVLELHGPSTDGLSFQERFEATFSHPYFPVAPADMRSRRTFRSAHHGDVFAWDDPESALRPAAAGEAAGTLLVRVFRNMNHPNGGVLNFRLEREGKSIVLATDIEGIEGEDGSFVDFARGADVLIHDAQYTDEEYEGATQGWGHSTWRMAVDVAGRAHARRLVLYHHDPAHDDEAVEAIERKAREKFPRCISACEGLEIRV